MAFFIIYLRHMKSATEKCKQNKQKMGNQLIKNVNNNENWSPLMNIICVQQKFDMRHDDAGNGFTETLTIFYIYSNIIIFYSSNNIDMRIELMVSVNEWMNKLDNKKPINKMKKIVAVICLFFFLLLFPVE